MSGDKLDLLPAAGIATVKQHPRSSWRCLVLVASLAIVIVFRCTNFWQSLPVTQLRHNDAKLCPQSDPLYPERHAELWKSLGWDFDQDAFTKRAVQWLGGAVRVPTESYDDMGPVGVDKRWEAFGPFHDYLVQSFPLTHKTLSLTKVNTYGLLYEWKGSDNSLKPLQFAAHQDVVPVEPKTVDQWKYPPYSGYYDGEFIWGRGSSDDKSGLIGILSSIETLLEKDFQPTRTIILSFGFDEEASGIEGASSLSEAILEKYGEHSIALLVDEGEGFGEVEGSIVAIPGIAEKGYMDTRVTVSTAGGHSSVPPPHTSIGILARLLVEFEANPIQPHLERGTPIYSNVQCLGQHAKDFPAHLRALVRTSVHSDRALRKLEAELIKEKRYRALIGTTQAIDLVEGGVKTNALPEEAWAVVNHRIATQSSVAAVQQRDTEILKGLAKDFNLTFTAFGSGISPQDSPTIGALTLTDAWGTALEPAPVTPHSEDSAPWQLLSGTIKATYNAHRGLEGADNIIVSPGIMSGNTDTRSYWKLTEHIIRYNHHNERDGGGLVDNIHTVDEHMLAESFVEMIRFFTTLILNVDETNRF
ncbi:carboxypeptidase S [Multifurca ochricompacta]|uniref:Carboxypeptidase S n=1 Tax=Multifurca ochricompacta TaxID=376703 RepID=A0AAD4LZC4_9AGAM|nr:carboxypeptidase S [Multifurca ochricompacta]